MKKYISYSEVVKKGKIVVTNQVKDQEDEMVSNQVKDQEWYSKLKELYGKACVAESINFIVEEASYENTSKDDMDKFSCNIATILARDREVVAVWLVPILNGCIAYLSKNSIWLSNDIEYIKRITIHLEEISKSAPDISRDSDIALIDEIFTYCSTKFISQLEKLKNDIKMGQEKSYNDVISFIDYVKISNVNEIDTMKKSKISSICKKFYDKVKKDSEDSTFHPKFLRHIKKVGSYARSAEEIIACTRKEKYKPLFSNIEVHKMPTIITNHPIFSWKNIIRRWADDSNYKRFTDECLKDEHIMKRMRNIYADKTTNQLQLDRDIKRHIYLHAELNILGYIMHYKVMKKVFIAVSKKCCFLCELYIDLVNSEGYNVIISEKHKKIYSGWKLPQVSDNNFEIMSLKHILNRLDQIIKNKIIQNTRNIMPDSDSSGESTDFDNDVNFDDYIEHIKN